jgi:hypothetical protein
VSTGTKTSLTATSEVLIPAMIAERVSATARPGSKLDLVINNADNELIAYLNTEQVYEHFEFFQSNVAELYKIKKHKNAKGGPSFRFLQRVGPASCLGRRFPLLFRCGSNFWLSSSFEFFSF